MGPSKNRKQDAIPIWLCQSVESIFGSLTMLATLRIIIDVYPDQMSSVRRKPKKGSLVFAPPNAALRKLHFQRQQTNLSENMPWLTDIFNTLSENAIY